jgi:chromate reductase
MTYTVGTIVGSIAQHSINRRFATALTGLAPANLEFVDIDIASLPFYSYDFDADYPDVALQLKQSIADVDALLYVTPEYNRSIPGVLKNAIDWASRPYGAGVLGKPSAIAGISLGPIGTALAQAHLRNILNFFNAPLYSQPELYIQQTDTLYTGETTFNPGTQQFLQGWMDGFAAFVAKQVG